jgi:hypothetical protein
VERDFAEWPNCAPPAGSAADQEVFAPQIELGIRIDHVLGDWLRVRITASAADREGSDSLDGSAR